ncbi:DUF2470 domain-containing protein [Microbacterium sp. CJ88]|uniref:DUF2470 domain-containing protein n=1 Tax=Microbacterium sp. CJ88 TaxID=3445672 RepID=UPI003F6559DE
MTHRFDDGTLTGVLGHMNGDHPDDNLLIVRAFGGRADAAGATMLDFDGDSGLWAAATADGESFEVRVPWPGGPISERPHVRREIVALYDAACARLGVEPRPHA